ncbi:MAG: FkbM family methyltransferase, partial [Candidatus Omnitrophota bacterium]
FIGLYTVAVAKRIGKDGKVIAFEPDKKNADALKKHLRLNKVFSKVEVINAAVGDINGVLTFHALSNDYSHVALLSNVNVERCIQIQSKTLDSVFHNKRVDVIKIDVEGYEGKVLLGARNLLKRKKGYPRAIFIEVHPYVWKELETTAEELVSLLTNAGYKVEKIDRNLVDKLEHYGEIVAVKE